MAIERLQRKNSYASSTPVTDGERLIAFFGNGGLVCYDMQGNLQWTQDLGLFSITHGPGTSPVLYKDTVIFIQDQNKADSLFMAFDKRTGEKLWQQKRPRTMGWANPILVHVQDHDELLYNGSHYVVGYSPDTGNELWRCAGPTKEAVPTLVTGGGLIYSASGRNGSILALRPAGQGDVTKSHLVWLNERGGPHVPSPVYHRDRLYLISDTGVCMCLNATTGQTIWQERLAGRFTASPVLVKDKLIMISEKGLTYILETGDTFNILAQNDLDEETLASPAVIDGKIYIRTLSHLYCISSE
jgi:outer membrane protein assembly factor BamB